MGAWASVRRARVAGATALLVAAGVASCSHVGGGNGGAVREPAEAGRFYPADTQVLRDFVHAQLAAQVRVTRVPVRAVLAPHAGYRFSAAVAAAAFKQLDPNFERVVILAGNHNGQVRFSGASIDRAARYRVPGLEVKVSAAADALRRRPGYVDAPAAHTMHMIEIELPFLAEIHPPSFEIIPIIVGELSPSTSRALAEDLARLDDGRTRFVFSVDLSHYYSYEEALALDRPCLESLTQLDRVEVARCTTDATQLLVVMTELAALRRWTPRLIGYANSGDVFVSERGRVVGYGALAFEERFVLTEREGQALLDIARSAIEARVRAQPLTRLRPLVARYPRLETRGAAFVTIQERGALRGCIGSVEEDEGLAASVARNAAAAATADARFPPVRPDELPALEVSVSILEPPRSLDGRGDALLAELATRHPGLVLHLDGRRSVFLPEVWELLPDVRQFLEQLCVKQDAPTACWRSPRARFEVFNVQRLTGP
jgi:AmmeMemoRadiSam system protein B/AmmeMemoRadiSam system protein A